MKLIDRYILRNHIAPFIFGTVVVLFLFLMQFLISSLEKLVGKGLSEWLIIKLIVYNMAWMVILSVPMGVLFSTLMAFGSMSMSHEVTIIKASGGSLIRMMMPVIIASILLYYGLFWFNDNVLPESNHQVKIMMNDITRKKPTFSLESGLFSTQLEGYTILSRKVDSASGIIRGITIYDMSQFQKRNIISADTGILKFTEDYKNLVLNLKNGEIHQLNLGSLDNYRIINFDKYQITIPATGFALDKSSSDFVSKGDRELNISDMQQIVDTASANKEKFLNETDTIVKKIIKAYIYGINQENYNSISTNYFGRYTKPVSKQYSISDTISQTLPIDIVLNKLINKINIDKSLISGQLNQSMYFDAKIRQYQVEIYKKYAIPFACLIFVFVGAPLGIITKGGNFGLSAGISLAFYVFYWICLIGGEKLADPGIVQPWLAMWLGNIIIGILGIILTLRVNFESLHFLDIRNIWSRLK